MPNVTETITKNPPQRRKTDKAKHHLWKWIGSMFMVQKEGVQAMSLTRVLSLFVFGLLCWRWIADLEVQSSLLHTFWCLVGLKGLDSLKDVITSRK